jgi:hypothetical protein
LERETQCRDRLLQRSYLQAMSGALPLKNTATRIQSFEKLAEELQGATVTALDDQLFDHLVGALLQKPWHVQP